MKCILSTKFYAQSKMIYRHDFKYVGSGMRGGGGGGGGCVDHKNMILIYFFA